MPGSSVVLLTQGDLVVTKGDSYDVREKTEDEAAAKGALAPRFNSEPLNSGMCLDEEPLQSLLVCRHQALVGILLAGGRSSSRGEGGGQDGSGRVLARLMLDPQHDIAHV